MLVRKVLLVTVIMMCSLRWTAGEEEDRIKKISDAAENIIQTLTEKSAKIDIVKPYNDGVEKIIEELTGMKDTNKYYEATKAMFKNAMDVIKEIEDDLENLQRLSAQMSKLKNHIIAENNEGRSKMDAAIATHSRKYFSQGMYFIATDRLKAKFLVSDADFASSTDTDDGTKAKSSEKPKETGIVQDVFNTLGKVLGGSRNSSTA